MIDLHRTVMAVTLGCSVLAAVLSTSVSAQQSGCTGVNLLDDIKGRDAAAFARIRKAADATKNGRHVLWKIEHDEFPDRAPSYLFGTIHVTDDRVQKFSPALDEALSLTRRIALEVDPGSNDRTEEALAAMQTTALLSNNAQLAEMLDKPAAERASVMLAKSGLPKEWQPRVKPWVAMMLTSTSECERRRLTAGKLPLDAELARQAENRGVGSFGLETTEMQFEALAALPDADQLAMLKASLAAYERIDDQVETLVRLYLTRDLGAIWPLQIELGKTYGLDAKVLEGWYLSVIAERNIRMRDRALMHLSYGGVLIAVGAMHLPGDSGLVELLMDAGYKLTPVE